MDVGQYGGAPLAQEPRGIRSFSPFRGRDAPCALLLDAQRIHCRLEGSAGLSSWWRLCASVTLSLEHPVAAEDRLKRRTGKVLVRPVIPGKPHQLGLEHRLVVCAGISRTTDLPALLASRIGFDSNTGFLSALVVSWKPRDPPVLMSTRSFRWRTGLSVIFPSLMVNDGADNKPVFQPELRLDMRAG